MSFRRVLQSCKYVSAGMVGDKGGEETLLMRGRKSLRSSESVSVAAAALSVIRSLKSVSM